MLASPETQTGTGTEPEGETVGHAWRTKWAAAEAASRPPGAPVKRIVALVFVSIIVLAVAVFFLVGGPARFSSRPVQRAPIINTVAPTAMPAQPAVAPDLFVPPLPAPAPTQP